MAGKSKSSPKPQGPILTLDSIVPGLQNLKILDLCRCARVSPSQVWQPGMICAYDGAWDRKHVVESVTHVGRHVRPYSNGKSYELWLVVLRPLGQFFADHRFKVATRGKPRQYELWGTTEDADQPRGKLGNFTLVAPVGGQLPKLPSNYAGKLGWIQKNVDNAPVPLGPDGKLIYSPPVEKKSSSSFAGSAKAKSHTPLPLKPAEAVLKSFRVKPGPQQGVSDAELAMCGLEFNKSTGQIDIAEPDTTLVEDLQAAGLAPVVIDEDFDFNTLPPLSSLLGKGDKPA